MPVLRELHSSKYCVSGRSLFPKRYAWRHTVPIDPYCFRFNRFCIVRYLLAHGPWPRGREFYHLISMLYDLSPANNSLPVQQSTIFTSGELGEYPTAGLLANLGAGLRRCSQVAKTCNAWLVLLMLRLGGLLSTERAGRRGRTTCPRALLSNLRHHYRLITIPCVSGAFHFSFTFSHLIFTLLFCHFSNLDAFIDFLSSLNQRS